jgi:hypothetical protein
MDAAVRDHVLAKGAQDFWIKGTFDFKRLGPQVERLLVAGAA